MYVTIYNITSTLTVEFVLSQINKDLNDYSRFEEKNLIQYLTRRGKIK